jgi:hypothetical protein
MSAVSSNFTVIQWIENINGTLASHFAIYPIGSEAIHNKVKELTDSIKQNADSKIIRTSIRLTNIELKQELIPQDVIYFSFETNFTHQQIVK